MAIPERFIDDLVSRSDIVDVVSDYVQLTKRSGSNMFGLCPFHNEKTPSFSVSPDKQIYHCFGCGKGGGVINFIMEIENLPFPDAVRFLAKRAGMEVPEDTVDDRTATRRSRLLALNKDAARFFYENLSKPVGAGAVEYINSRGLNKDVVVRFGLGAAPDSWNTLSDAMQSKGYSVGELLEAGLVKRGRNGGVYDVFRNRLMFPVIDVHGDVVGFSGRIIGDGEPKYLNSPDTPVFQKSRNLFALNLARKTKRGMLMLVEGNIDVVMLHQAGFDCAVASLGTSLTTEQARLMARYTKNAVLCYDSDNAGVKAVQRAIPILESTGLSVRVLRMSGAKDPDEYIKKHGADSFTVLLERSENHIEYTLLSARDKYDLATDDGRLGFMREATGLLAALPNAVERDIYSARAAEYAGVSLDAVKSEVNREVRRRIRESRQKRERDASRPELAVQPAERSLRYDNVPSAMAEEGIVRLLMLDPSLVKESGELKQEDFTSEFLGKVYSVICRRYNDGETVSLASLTRELTQEEMSHLSTVLQKPESLADSSEKLRDYIKRMQTEQLRARAKTDPIEAMKILRDRKGLSG